MTKILPTAITTSTRNWLVSSALLFTTLLGLTACEEPKEIGLAPTVPVGVFYTDTLTVQRSTIRFDSVWSQRQSSLLTGRYKDPLFGQIEAAAYTQLAMSSGVFNVLDATNNAVPANQIVYDSTRLFLTYDFAYGDTTAVQTISVFPLRDSINTLSKFDISSPAPAIATQPIAQTAVAPTVNAGRFLRLPVADSYGQQLLALANTDATKSNVAFRAAVPGLAIVSRSADAAAVLGFTTNGQSTFIALYYHIVGETTSRSTVFVVGNGRFNRITTNRVGTPLATLGKGQALPPVAGRTFIQPSTGVTTRLTFPTLSSLSRNGRIAVNRADLVITITQPQPSTLFVPFYMGLAEVDAQNQLRRSSPNNIVQLIPDYTTLFNRTESNWISPQLPVLNTRASTYTFNMGGYFQSVLAGQSPNTGLAILTPGVGSGLYGGSSAIPFSDQAQLYVNNRLWRAVLDGQASAKVLLFYTNSQ